MDNRRIISEAGTRSARVRVSVRIGMRVPVGGATAAVVRAGGPAFDLQGRVVDPEARVEAIADRIDEGVVGVVGRAHHVRRQRHLAGPQRPDVQVVHRGHAGLGEQPVAHRGLVDAARDGVHRGIEGIAQQAEGADRDPKKHPDAVRFEELDHDEVIARDLQVMDTAAFALCRDAGLPLRIFDMAQPGVLLDVLRGANIGTLVRGRG